MKAGRPSQTALLIARSMVVGSRNPGWSRFYDPRSVALCETFLEDHLAWPGLQLGVYRRCAYRWATAWFERLTLPGIQLHYALRKRFIEDEVRSAIDAGYSRVEVHGAGFDTLATRLTTEFPEVDFMELDHPDTQQAKQRSLERLGRLNSSFTFQAIDLNGWRGRDRSADQIEAPTVVVAEGVLMYLAEPSVQRFFTGLREAAEAPVRIVFTFMAPDQKGRLRFHKASRFVDLWLDLKGEPFVWGIDPNMLGVFLERCGFTLENLVDHGTLRQRYLDDWPGEPLDLAEGEMIGVALSD